MTSVAPIGKERAQLRSWEIHTVVLAALLALILFVYRDPVATTIQVWWIYPSYSHCFLVIPISVWLVWERLPQLRQFEPLVDLRALIAIPIFALLGWLGELSTINEVRELAVVGLIQTVIVLMIGARASRTIWFPIAFLVFLVPTGEYLIGPMQQFAARLADITLTIAGLPHFSQGTVIEVTNGRFEVAAACAGLRFFIATVTLGTLFSYLMFRRWYKVALFLLSCVLIPIVANGLRIAGIILLAHATNNAYGTGEDHVYYGWIFNVSILLALFLLASRFRDATEVAADRPVQPISVDGFRRIVVSASAAAILIALGPALAAWHPAGEEIVNKTTLLGPLNIPGWLEQRNQPDWGFTNRGYDAMHATSFISQGADYGPPVDLSVGVYASSRPGHTLPAKLDGIWNEQRWALVTSVRHTAQVRGRDVAVFEQVLAAGGEKRMVWIVYWVDGQYTASLIKAKLLQVRGAFDGRTSEAIVTISTMVDSTDDVARHRLSATLAVLDELRTRLRAVGHHSQSPTAKN